MLHNKRNHARDLVGATHGTQWRNAPALRARERATRREAAAFVQLADAGHGTFDRAQPFRSGRNPGSRSEQPARVGMGRTVEDVQRRAHLHDAPAYMTATRSHISAITPRSWVISRTDMLLSRCSLRTSSRICAWIVTSSAVVGSSAIRRRGLPASAMAIITRWRMPPESSCGYASIWRSGSGISTRRSNAMASLRAALPCSARCQRSTSPICVPTRMTGLSEVIGSWKIIAMSLPRSERISSPDSCSRSLSSSSTRPRRTVMGCGSRPMIDNASMLFPEPDSPTTPSTSLARIVSDTALRISGPSGPSPVVNCSTESNSLIGWSPPSGGRARRATHHPTG